MMVSKLQIETWTYYDKVEAIYTRKGYGDMIGIDKDILGGIPSLIVVAKENAEKKLPILTYFHGFTSAKEHNLPLAFLMAEKGYRVILPDSLYHGERDAGLSKEKLRLAFWDIVVKNTTEIEAIYNELNRRGLLQDKRFGVAGTSMGGITTAAALAQYPWIKTAAILMGTPTLTDYAKQLVQTYKQSGELQITKTMEQDVYALLEPYDLSQHMEMLNERPLLFWHGDKDPVVPFSQPYAFYHDALMYYKKQANIRFIREKNRGHKVSRLAILQTVEWFSQHL
ncbi:MAG TPA: alpha/beta fold hydrolase [Bacillota bacterium]|nr:alpha/beta fold hydrolase [Bacillota bacterium]